MTRFPILFLLAVLMLRATDASADLIVDINPNPVSIVEGTTSVTFDIVLSQTAGEAFNGFTLAFGVGDGGMVLGMPQDGDNLLISGFSTAGGILDGTNFTSTVSGGEIGQSAILFNFTLPGGDTSVLSADGILASFTLDTTGTLAGQSFVLDPNIGGFSSASDGGGNAITLMPQLGTLDVTAVPEPSSFLLVGLIFCSVIYLRNRFRTIEKCLP